MPIVDYYNIRVNGSDTLYCSACDREVAKLTSWLLADIIEEAQGHLSLHHRGPNGTS